MILEKILRALGKTYSPDKDIPLGLILGVVWKRLFWLLLGGIFFRKIVFVSPSANFVGRRRLKIGSFTTFEKGCRVDGYSARVSVIGDRTKIGAYSIVSSTSHFSKMGVGFRIGSDCGISEYCYFGAAGGIEIGNDVIVGQYVSMHSQNHVFDDVNVKIRDQGVVSEGIVIGNNVWIGAKVTVLDGAVVGDNSVIAAGAVVSGSFPPGVVIGGVPARVIKYIDGKK